MIEPRQKDIGRRVRQFDDRGVEGIVTGFDIHHVFVRYGDHTTSKGKRRADLIWADEPAQ
jgi:hypothetical protein